MYNGRLGTLGPECIAYASKSWLVDMETGEMTELAAGSPNDKAPPTGVVGSERRSATSYC
jgi:hypothetical protein